MNKKSWLIVGLSLAMVASIGVGISACGGETHTHEYTKWQHDDTQHWKVCPADDAMDPAGKSAHDFTNGDCECGAKEPVHVHTFDTTTWENNETSHWHPATCEHTEEKGDLARHNFSGRECTVCHFTKEAEVYIEGLITSHSTNRWHTAFTLAGGSITQVRTDCIKMTPSEDKKTYTAEVYLTARDEFAIYEYASGMTYPSGAALQPASKALRVEESNTYLITWVLDAETPTVRIHDHNFTKYGVQGDQHYLYCEADNTIKTDSYEAHTFEGGKCSKCGAEEAKCEHKNGAVFKYTDTTLPEANTEGGTLQKYCPDCGEEVTDAAVTYTKIGAGLSTEVEIGSTDVLYSNNQAKITVTATKAGTVGLSLENVLLPDGFVFAVRDIAILDSSLTSARTILSNRQWQTTGRAASTTTKWKDKITFDGGSPDDTTMATLKKITFAVDATEVQDGKTCKFTVTIDLLNTTTNSWPKQYPIFGFLATAFEGEATATVNTVYALPASKKED